MPKLRHLLPVGLAMALITAFLPQPAWAEVFRQEVAKADLVVVFKGKRILQLRREGKVLRTYRIALGGDPDGAKRQEGDARTPEGVYSLDWRNPNSNFYRSIHVSYPRARDREAAARWGVSPGGLIMVHGLPNGLTAAEVGHPWNDWTNGCIAVTNEEIDEIWAAVDDGTPIIIYP